MIWKEFFIEGGRDGRQEKKRTILRLTSISVIKTKTTYPVLERKLERDVLKVK